MTVIAASDLVKSYNGHRALDGFSMQVRPGRIVGLIGPNGSGKTTALNALMGLCRCDSGELSVLGLDPQENRSELMQRVSYIADTGILPRWMKVRDLLRYVADVQPAFDLERANARLADTRIRSNQRIRTLSKGMGVQLHLAIVLACDSELMVLDEPTLGLDLLYRQTFYDQLLADFFSEQRAIVITTHEVAEVEQILTDVVFIHEGRVVLDASMERLAERFVSLNCSPDQQHALEELTPLSMKTTLRGTTAVFDGEERERLARLGTLTTPTLPELFVAVVGNSGEESS